MGKRWFAIESKSYDIFVEGIGRKQKFFIIERSKGAVSWIRFGGEGLRTFWKGVVECYGRKIPKNWRVEWQEEKRYFLLECRSNRAGRFLLCLVRDGEGKKHSIVFPEGKGFVKG